MLNDATSDFSKFLKFYFIVLCLLVSIMIPLLPYLVNKAPFIGDSWVHMKIAEKTIRNGRYEIIEYNERWPVVNFLLVFLSLASGLSPFYAGIFVPFMVGLTTLPLYCLCKRLNLSSYAAIAAVSFLSLDPLYSYITFSGAVMKETATYYLFLSMLLAAVIALDSKITPSKFFLALILGMGIVLGHHYAGLVICLFLTVLSTYITLSKLKGGTYNLRSFLFIPLIYILVFLAWNWNNYSKIEGLHQFLELSDGLFLIAILVVVCVTLYQKFGLLYLSPWLTIGCVLIAVFGLRGRLYSLLQPVPKITIWEAWHYLMVGAIAFLGSYRGFKALSIRAFASTTISLVIFAFLWGSAYPGFVLLIKSLHYFGLLLAILAGYAISFFLRYKYLGKLLLIFLIILLIYASKPGTELALKGLGAYYREELDSLSNFKSKMNLHGAKVKVFGDTRVNYLGELLDVPISGLTGLKKVKEPSLIVLLKPNLQLGYLLGYDWVEKKVLTPADRLLGQDKLVDSPFLQIWRINNW